MSNSIGAMQGEHTYAAIDLKSFYASVECVDRLLDPLTTNLVVADASRTAKTICLAVSPSLKSYGIPGRARLFEVIKRVKEVNRERLLRAPGHKFTGSSCNAVELSRHPEYALDFITAPPRMAHYIEYSTKIYEIYLHYIAKEDIHPYSIDEVFLDVTGYLKIYHMDALTLTRKILQDVLAVTGITATAGIAPNLYLCKVAMDIVAKHCKPDENGARIAVLSSEEDYRRQLWEHQPLTDFWRVGRGYAAKLNAHGLYTMGDIARCSLGGPNDFYNEELLYKLFGINAELLIDHAWGYEPVSIADIKAYKPASNSVGSGQVLSCPYEASRARLVLQEMADLLALDLVEKKLVADQLVLTVGYDTENLKNPAIASSYQGEVTSDHYGRQVPKHAHGTKNLKEHTSSSRLIMEAAAALFDEIVNPIFYVRRLNLTANHVVEESDPLSTDDYQQLNLFTDYSIQNETAQIEHAALEKERKMQEAMLSVKKKYGKNAILKGMNLQEGATTIQRNSQIGGHKA